jgi:hypothetical protein
MIELVPHAEGVLVPVKAEPGSRHQGVRGERAGCLKVALRAVAEKGRANQRLVAVLAEELAVKKQQVELLSGATAGRKRFLIRGVELEELRRRVETRLAAVKAAQRRR